MHALAAIIQFKLTVKQKSVCQVCKCYVVLYQHNMKQSKFYNYFIRHKTLVFVFYSSKLEFLLRKWVKVQGGLTFNYKTRLLIFSMETIENIKHL